MTAVRKKLLALVVLLVTLSAVPAPLAGACPEETIPSGCFILWDDCRASSACHNPKDCLEFRVICYSGWIKRVSYGCKC